jgi:hypothetical protein
MCMQRRRRVAVWCINGPSISTVILITAQRNIFQFPLGVTDFNVPCIRALAIWRLYINIVNWLLLCLPLNIWKYWLCIFCVVNRLCFQRLENNYIPFNKNIRPIQEKVWERKNFKNPARSPFFCLNSDNIDKSPYVFSWAKLASQRGKLIMNYASTFRDFAAMHLEVCETHLLSRVGKLISYNYGIIFSFLWGNFY